MLLDVINRKEGLRRIILVGAIVVGLIICFIVLYHTRSYQIQIGILVVLTCLSIFVEPYKWFPIIISGFCFYLYLFPVLPIDHKLFTTLTGISAGIGIATLITFYRNYRRKQELVKND
jgi:hypothetical protein